MFVNTQVFREAALDFKKYGRYQDGDYGGYECMDYWDRETDRVNNGYEVGGVKITGKHYLYLNYLPILRTVETENLNSKVFKTKKKKVRRDSDFVDFWDEDYILFHTWDIAREGIAGDTFEEQLFNLDKISKHLSIPIVRTEDNLAGGKNHLWLKPRGVGAEQPLTEILITPQGEITMGDVKVGTELYDKHGKVTKVTEILPQGYKEVWKVKLLDGREVECGEKHLWTVETRLRKGKPEYKTLTTKQMVDNGLIYNHSTGQKTYKYKIPELKPVQFAEAALPISPYVLGALLGDGAINGKNIRLASDDIEIVDKVIADLNKTWLDSYEYSKDTSNNNYLIKLKDRNEYLGTNKNSYGDNTKFGCNPLKRELELLKVNRKCNEKFIPSIYKYSSVEQRLELVKGLMDTDGSISEQGYCEFTNKNEQLIDDLAYVLRSLGIYCSKGISDRGREQTIVDRTGRSCTFTEEKYFRLYIATNINIFNLKRKSSRINFNKRTKTSCPIVSIENTKVLVKQQCIIVDNEEHLYLTKDFIVTHNSWKGAVIPIYNQFFIKNSTTFMVANEEKYLTDDGIYTKYLEYKNTLLGRHDNWRDLGMRENGNFRCAGFRRTFSKQDIGGMHFRASRVESVEDGGVKQLVEVGGKKSSVYGLPINGNPNNIRGKRGHIVYEEFGSFPRVKDTWEVAQQGVEQDGAVFATQYGFGTGGDEKNVSIADLTLMFNDPVTYNILEFTNVYDKELYGLKSAYFTSCLKSLNFIDKDGNTNTVESEKYFDEQRERKKNGTDPTALVKYCAEKPKTPSEALMGSKGNIFPVKELTAHKTKLLNTKLHRELIVAGRLERTAEGKIRFVKTEDLPFEDYPVKPNTITKSAVCIVNPPYKTSAGVPKNMYRISVDPYRNDSSSGDSIGSIWVVENPNNLTAYKGDKIVAWYNARPNEQSDFNEVLFNLAEYYHCKIAPENDEPGGIIDYAKINKKLHLLEEEFELAYDESIKTKSSSKKQFGMHIASGKDDLRKLQGDKYIQEWLWRKRAILEDGTIIYNFNLIYDLGFIEELIQYGEGKNADRISSFRINMFYEREFLYKEKTVSIEVKVRDPFFSMSLFN